MIIINAVSEIEGLLKLQSQRHIDSRGYLTEIYNKKDYKGIGLENNFIQDNLVFSKENVLRGFHVNFTNPQAKLITVLSGKIYDVVIDLREKSATHKKCYSTILSSKNGTQLYIPEGIAHGYLALTDTLISFKSTAHYLPGTEIGFAWNSKEFNIKWPIDEKQMIISERDQMNKQYCDGMIRSTAL